MCTCDETCPCCYRSRISEAPKSFETTANVHNSENGDDVGQATTVRAIATVTLTPGDVFSAFKSVTLSKFSIIT